MLRGIRVNKEKVQEIRQKASWVLFALPFLFVLVVGAMMYGAVSASAGSQAPIVCPPAPEGFVLHQNVEATIDGERVYLACAWVGGIVTESPLR